MERVRETYIVKELCLYRLKRRDTGVYRRSRLRAVHSQSVSHKTYQRETLTWPPTDSDKPLLYH